jgi:hypothetical protein
MTFQDERFRDEKDAAKELSTMGMPDVAVSSLTYSPPRLTT